MAKIHALKMDKNSKISVVLHSGTPTGDNGAGVPWKTAALNSGEQGTSLLSEGTGPGQISTAELAQVMTGDILEITGELLVTPGNISLPAVNELADQIIDEYKARLAADLEYFGYEIN